MNEVIAKRSFVGIALCGLALLVLYALGPGFRGVNAIGWFLLIAAVQCAIYFAAVAITWNFPPRRRSFVLVVGFACLFRLALVFVAPNLSDDVYRYVWDGRVQAAGINPYRHVPADERLAPLRDEAIYPHINRRDYAPTIYPPIAQLIFLATTRISESVTWMKLTMVVFEAVAMFAVVLLLDALGLARERLVVFAWHPLVVWEVAGNGHLDAIMLAFVALATLAMVRSREAFGGMALACATLVKFFPLALFPAMWRRPRWRLPVAFALTVAAAYLPYLSVGQSKVFGFLAGYVAEEGLASGQRFFLLNAGNALMGTNIQGTVYRVLAILTLAVAALAILFRQEADNRKIPGRVLLLAVVVTVLLSPHYAWYFVWLVPMMCLISTRWLIPMLALTSLSFVLYLTWLGDQPGRMLAINAVIYLPAAAIMFGTLWIQSRRERFA